MRHTEKATRATTPTPAAAAQPTAIPAAAVEPQPTLPPLLPEQHPAARLAARAIERFDRVIRLWPEHASAYLEKGNVHGFLGQYPAAAELYRKTIELRPSYATGHRNLAIALAKSNKQKDAVEMYRTYLNKCPDASDKKDVLKIINDWEKAQQKKKH